MDELVISEPSDNLKNANYEWRNVRTNGREIKSIVFIQKKKNKLNLYPRIFSLPTSPHNLQQISLDFFHQQV